jgi:hypothetical protein
MTDDGHDRTHRQPGDALAPAIGDPDRLLHGEDPKTRHLDDALHWKSVYAELLDFKKEVLDATRHRLETLSESAKEEVAGMDVPMLEAEADRLHKRHAFWCGRVEKLES